MYVTVKISPSHIIIRMSDILGQAELGGVLPVSRKRVETNREADALHATLCFLCPCMRIILSSSSCKKKEQEGDPWSKSGRDVINLRRRSPGACRKNGDKMVLKWCWSGDEMVLKWW